jgi:DNA-binding MarR family transcriptional regulator
MTGKARMLAKGDARRSRTRSLPETDAVRHRAVVERLIQDKARRARLFECYLFDDSAFDIILALYAAELDGRQILVSRVGQVSGIPQTTSLRWLAKLEQSGLIDRISAKRYNSYFTVLTKKATTAMRAYVADR